MIEIESERERKTEWLSQIHACLFGGVFNTKVLEIKPHFMGF